MFGGWSIDKALFDEVKKIVPDNGIIMEFGSGAGTDELLKYYWVISYEHNPKYATQRPDRHIMIHAPLKNGWYDIDSIGYHMANLLLIDGPPGQLRENLPMYLLYGIKIPVIFDDVNRKGDFDTMAKFCKLYKYDYKIFIGEQKNFAVCMKSE